MADQIPIYDELSIRIQQGEGNQYRTFASAADGATASGTFVPPFNETELDNFILRVGRQRLPMRSYRSSQMEIARQFGSRLFEALIVDEVRDVYRSARAVAEKSRRGLRLTLCLTDVPELMDIPWEFLYEPPRFLSQSIYSPVVRSLDLTQVPPSRQIDLPLNVLGLVSSPLGFNNLDVAHEEAKLEEALAPLCDQGAVTIRWLENGTLRELDEVISRRQGIHVFHYIGHGAYDSRADGGLLVLENEHGEPQEVSGEELGLLLQDERDLRLVVLNSCEGARSSHLDPFSGVASSLVRYGFPAVIGMQFEITDQAAIAFAARLYASLAQGLPVDAALAQSRKSIFAAGNDIEFGTPVLFLRGTEGRLFDIVDPPLPAEDEVFEHPLEPAEEIEDPPAVPVVEAFEYFAEGTSEPEYQPERQPLDLPPWLPYPLQEWLQSFKATPAQTLSRVSNRRLTLVFLLLVVLGVVLTNVYGEQNSSGDRESVLGAIVTAIGSLGLILVFVKFVYEKARRRFDRLRNWWTGNGY